MAENTFFGAVGIGPWERRGAVASATALGVWAAYTPTVTADTTAPNLGTGATQHGRYTRIGNTVIGKFVIYFGTGGTSGSGAFRISLPVAAVLPPLDHYVVGTGYVYNTDNGNIASVNYYVNQTNSGWVHGLLHEDVAAVSRFVTDTSPFSTGWTAGDRILGNFTYEAA